MRAALRRARGCPQPWGRAPQPGTPRRRPGGAPEASSPLPERFPRARRTAGVRASPQTGGERHVKSYSRISEMCQSLPAKKEELFI
ncbi:hypothetical protein AV530_018763 [Patagioenas fasciata monilis]|uniref:Uncharacterized protein n=1 Tax=Patagioenas fasciata monilis TaxID=372326 RepID=A0A1V4JJE9_PATFA|nr:hypothetical protein AV530_018763 [Patagioenas fasciata monilis]